MEALSQQNMSRALDFHFPKYQTCTGVETRFLIYLLRNWLKLYPRTASVHSHRFLLCHLFEMFLNKMDMPLISVDCPNLLLDLSFMWDENTDGCCSWKDGQCQEVHYSSKALWQENVGTWDTSDTSHKLRDASWVPLNGWAQKVKCQ